MTTDVLELPEPAKAQIGKTFQTLYDTIEEGAVRKYIQAMGDSFERYLDPNDPGRLLYAPPLFVSTLAKYPIGSEPPHTTDGLGGTQETFDVDLPLKRTVVGGQEWELHRLPRIGERVAIETRIADIKRTLGRKSNEMYIVIKEVTYRGTTGDVISVVKHTRVKR